MKKILEKLTENGIIVSIFLGFAYLFAYNYHKGILDYYNIPLIYIDLNIANIIEMFVGIITFLYTLYLVLSIITDCIPRIKTYIGKQVLFITIAFFIILVFHLVFFEDLLYIGLFVVAFCLYICVTLLRPIVTVKGKMKYREKWFEASKKIQSEALEEKENIEKMHLYPYRRLIKIIGLVVCLVMLLCNTLDSAGKSYAKNIEDYYVAIDYNNKVIVHCTDDYYILMERNKNQLSNSYQVVPTSEIGTISLMHIGKLNLKKQENS